MELKYKEIYMNILWQTFQVLLVMGSIQVARGDEDLARKILIIQNSANTTPGVSEEEIERQLLELIPEATDAKIKGDIYVALANVIVNNLHFNGEKVKQYANEALKYPIDIVDAGRMYTCLSSVEVRRAMQTPGIPDAKAVEERARPSIQGLALVLEQLTIDSFQPLPGINPYDIPEDSPQYETVVRNHERQVAAHFEARKQNELLRYRNIFSERVSQLYPHGNRHDPAFCEVVLRALHDTNKVESVLQFFDDRRSIDQP